MRQTPQARFMEVIEMGMRQQHQVNRREVLDPHPRSLDTFEKKKPVGEVWIDQHIEIVKLNQKRGVPNPCHRDLAIAQFGKCRLLMLSGAPRQKGFPNHLMEKGPWVEMLGRRQILE